MFSFPLRRAVTLVAMISLASSLLGAAPAGATGPATSDAPPTSTATLAPSTEPPWFGALQAQPNQAARLRAAGLRTVTLEIGWDSFEPQPGVVDKAYLARQKEVLRQWRAAGFQVFLDTGLQYPPTWAFALPGGTRFVNQFGETWSGGTGSNLVNAVFNPSVRAAQRRYYSLLAASFPAGSFAAVRVGGLHMGEMSYPPADGRANTLWMYDASAQAGSPLPGWKPGAGSTVAAQTGLRYYLDSLNGYAAWLLATTSEFFPRSDLQLMLPSWGLRPGHLDAALAAGLKGTTSAEINNLITEGLDWTKQVPLLQQYGTRGVAYTTWLDAPSDHNTDLQYMSPVDYLATLTTPRRIPLAGENTGQGTPATLALSLERVERLGLRGMLWMTAADLLASNQLQQTFAGATGAVFLIEARSR